MRSHRLLLIVCLVAGAGLSAALSAHAQRPGGPPPGAPPPPPPPAGAPPAAHAPGGPGNAPSSGSGTSSSAGSSPHAGLPFGPVGRWWDDKSVVHTVGISSNQQKKMDSIFDANKPAILSTYKTFLAEKAKLDALGKQSNVDQARMFAAIDSVNQARAALQKANTQMLLQIRQQMDADQIDKLEKLQ